MDIIFDDTMNDENKVVLLAFKTEIITNKTKKPGRSVSARHVYLQNKNRPDKTGLLCVKDANCLRVTSTHDAYLENGTLAGLTVGILIIAYD